MNERIRLLDCTLRDGGHLNESRFGENVIRNVIKRLIEAKIDIIEAGFLWGDKSSPDVARFLTIEDVKRILPDSRGDSKISLMADSVDLSNLEPNDGTIDYIRLSFKRSKIEWAFKTAEVIRDKGYKFFMNPIYCNTYTDSEYLELIEQINALHPYGFSIVDTFGTMRIRDLDRRVSLVDYNLDPDIVLGLHLHENLGLSYSLAQHFLTIANPKRDIIIDCSLLGMGRAPGNLCAEQIMDHLNLEYGKNYDTEPALDAIDDYISPLKEKTPWGYSIPYLISAKYCLPRSYAEYLMGKSRLRTRDIQRILKSVVPEKSQAYDEDYIENLYRSYMDVEYDSSEAFAALKKLADGKSVLLISPGASIVRYQDRIQAYIETVKPFVVAINFVPNQFDVDCVFCTNVKRLDKIISELNGKTLIVTSNIIKDYSAYNYVISYNDAVYISEEFCDDSTIMMLNVLKKSGIEAVTTAGFDGHENQRYEFFSSEFKPSRQNIVSDKLINDILKNSMGNIKLEFLTPSSHEGYET